MIAAGDRGEAQSLRGAGVAGETVLPCGAAASASGATRCGEKLWRWQVGAGKRLLRGMGRAGGERAVGERGKGWAA